MNDCKASRSPVICSIRLSNCGNFSTDAKSLKYCHRLDPLNMRGRACHCSLQPIFKTVVAFAPSGQCLTQTVVVNLWNLNSSNALCREVSSCQTQSLHLGLKVRHRHRQNIMIILQGSVAAHLVDRHRLHASQAMNTAWQNGRQL